MRSVLAGMHKCSASISTVPLSGNMSFLRHEGNLRNVLDRQSKPMRAIRIPENQQVLARVSWKIQPKEVYLIIANPLSLTWGPLQTFNFMIIIHPQLAHNDLNERRRNAVRLDLNG